jgi:hypothetical protein
MARHDFHLANKQYLLSTTDDLMFQMSRIFLRLRPFVWFCNMRAGMTITAYRAITSIAGASAKALSKHGQMINLPSLRVL